MHAVYRVEGQRVDTGPDAAGPWHPAMQHGAAPAALLAWLADPLLPESLHESRLDVPGPDCCRELNADERIKSPFLAGVSARIAVECQRRSGPAAIWFRANRPIVEGELIGPAMRAAIAADFCNGVSSVLDPKEWSFINGDVTLNLARLPVGEWILVNAETSLGRDGVGVASARLADATGYFGRAAQSLIVERR